MFLFRRFIPILSVLILGIIFEALLAYPGQLLNIWIGLTVIVSASLLSLLKKDYWSMLPIFLITILFFNSGIYLFQ